MTTLTVFLFLYSTPYTPSIERIFYTYAKPTIQFVCKTDAVNKRDFRLKDRDFSVFDSDENLYRDSVDIGKLICIRIFRSMITK